MQIVRWIFLGRFGVCVSVFGDRLAVLMFVCLVCVRAVEGSRRLRVQSHGPGITKADVIDAYSRSPSPSIPTLCALVQALVR